MSRDGPKVLNLVNEGNLHIVTAQHANISQNAQKYNVQGCPKVLNLVNEGNLHIVTAQHANISQNAQKYNVQGCPQSTQPGK
jgi:hypothetical protein